jgi:hypothetical protein
LANLVSELGFVLNILDLTPETIENLLHQYGPVMVVDLEKGVFLHARVIIGITYYCNNYCFNTKLWILDPDALNNNSLVK